MVDLFEETASEEDDFAEIGVTETGHDVSLLPPHESHFLLGHEKVEDFFLDLIKADKVPHGVLFKGQKGIGKSSFAYRLARFLFKHGKTESADAGLFGEEAPKIWPENMEIDAEDPIFRRVASGGHPDLKVIAPAEGKQSLDVEQVREIIPFLRQTASEGGWRIVIVDDASTMTRNAQNALLKILEEPPQNTLLILVTHNSGAFLPTIKSRCRSVVFSSPDREMFGTLMHRKDLSLGVSDLNLLYEVFNGSIGNTIDFIDNDGISSLHSLIGVLAMYPSLDNEHIHLFCENFARGTKVEVWKGFQRTFLWVFQCLAMSQARAEPLPSVLHSLAALQTGLSLAKLLEICEALKAHFEQAERGNLDKRQAAFEAFMIIQT